jgi:hypothetical protein
MNRPGQAIRSQWNRANGSKVQKRRLTNIWDLDRSPNQMILIEPEFASMRTLKVRTPNNQRFAG